jgi:tetratricopeptide (TPR) repeat protein
MSARGETAQAGKGKQPAGSPRTQRSLAAPRSKLPLILVFGAVLLGFGFLVNRLVPRPPPIIPVPEPDLVGVDPVVAEAVKEARNLLIKNREAPDAWGNYGLVLRAHDFAKEANLALGQAEVLDPDNFIWPYVHGVSLTVDNPKEAEARLVRAAAIRPDDPFTRLRLVEMLVQQNRIDEARVHLDVVAARHSGDPRVQFNLGNLAWLSGNAQEAVEWLERSAETAPGRRGTYQLLARAYQQLGKSGEAEAQLALVRRFADEPPLWPDPYIEAVFKLRRDVQSLVDQSDAFEMQGNMPAAVEKMQEAVARQPENPVWHATLATKLFQAGRNDEAIKVLDTALAGHPQSPELLFRRGVAYFLNNDIQNALAFFERTTAAKPDDELAWYNVGFCRQNLGDVPGAMQAYRQSIVVDPEMVLAHVNLGKLLRDTGDTQGAIDQLKMALKIDPKAPEAQQILDKLQPSF